ncbi:MAG: hypothetical protein PVI92_14055 [Chromatiales bacterium]|jgi:hypothetical protein
MKLLLLRHLITFSTLLLALSVSAEELGFAEAEVIDLTAEKSFPHIIHEGRSVKAQRVQEPDDKFKGSFATTVPKCPPFSIQPEQVDPRVTTAAKLELFGEVCCLNEGTITRIIEQMGFMEGDFKTGHWRFSNVEKLVFWCNRSACGQSLREIKGVFKTGCPHENALYFRSGMQMGQLWGADHSVTGMSMMVI